MNQIILHIFWLSLFVDESNNSPHFLTCIDEEITLKRLNYITEDDLTYIFRNSKLGEKIEFRYHLTEWKKKFVRSLFKNLYM